MDALPSPLPIPPLLVTMVALLLRKEMRLGKRYYLQAVRAAGRNASLAHCCGGKVTLVSFIPHGIPEDWRGWARLLRRLQGVHQTLFDCFSPAVTEDVEIMSSIHNSQLRKLRHWVVDQKPKFKQDVQCQTQLVPSTLHCFKDKCNFLHSCDDFYEFLSICFAYQVEIFRLPALNLSKLYLPQLLTIK